MRRELADKTADRTHLASRALASLAEGKMAARVGFLPWQKAFLQGQRKKPVKTGNNYYRFLWAFYSKKIST